LKELISIYNQNNNDIQLPLFENDSYYNYTLNLEENKFIKWEDITPKFNFNEKTSFDEIIIPTVDSTTYYTISETLLKSH